MARKRKYQPTLPAGWVKADEYQANGRHITRGTELRITGERGRFRFVTHTTTPTSEWVDVWDKDGRWRSFNPGRIRTVHVKRRMRPGKAA